jgi:hypothetical protein
MSRLKRLDEFFARHAPWVLLVLFVTGTIAGGLLARREHLPEECLPAQCTIYGTDAETHGASSWNAILRLEATSEAGHPVGRFRMTLDARGDTRERALEIADDRWKYQSHFACYYHPIYRDYLTLDREEGRWGIPLAVSIFFFLASLVMVVMVWFDAYVRPRPEGRRVYAFEGRDSLARLFRARDFIPEEPPAGWSVPFKLRDEEAWAMDIGDEGMIVRLERQGPFWGLRAFITTRGGAQLPSDWRCAEILGHLQGLGEWLECEPGDFVATRVWLAFPRAQRPRFRVPEGPSWPPEPAAKPRLAAARAHLPEKLPPRWSLPVALNDDHGTGWTDGGWLMAVDETLMALVTLCTSEGRDKLAVSLFHSDGSDVGDVEAVEVLRHFRGVFEFSQGTRAAEDSFVTYLGDIRAKGRDSSTLN